MRIEKIKTEGLAHLSYFLSADGEAAIIDPRRDIDIYLELARAEGAVIKHVFETHRNEDLISGAPLVKRATGAEVWHGPHPEQPIRYANETRDGQVFEIGGAVLKVLETPGHTDDSLSYVLYDKSFGQDPVGVFTGDALFVGDVGRTDFYPDRKREVAGLLYDSLLKLIALGDQCLIYPAHGAGSVCGSGMADREFSSIGHERKNNPRLQLTDRESFIDAKVAEHHYIPPYFERMEQCNMLGAETTPATPLPCSPAVMLDPGEHICLDVRGIFDFAGGHRPGSLCIPHDMIAAFAGWLLPVDKPILLIARDQTQALNAATTLYRIGFDHIGGYISGVMPLAVNDRPLGAIPFAETETIRSRLDTSPNGWTLLDVRAKDEYENGHLQGARHAYVGELPDAVNDMDPDTPVTVMCGSGARATIAASVLKRQGFSNVDVYIGSMQAWTAAGHATSD
ncbi:MBL fold metallo-hydrolase [Pseudohongiella sp.]|uniref:Rhodanese domain-containing protein n=1 Tax=marine sediment metagenome TaxID=412755 RepID=A0A0F9W3F8_9ZZZZ|nr:MBL fold metallo-hydrolase [Pseudohongiella sp.]HDZ08310.1 MBL fold metallo-hydrolase [Pseudohongiella sp.]HEA62586.1 MBL fold metallo-hydrolase [Pseudohongiella sp.]